jgi:hypothetical protein
MSTRTIVQQLRAVQSGLPVPKYSTLHLRLAENPFMVAFVRMAGESRPWGIAFGRLQDKSPRILVAGDGRNRDDIAKICEEFGVTLLQYCRTEGHTFNPITKENIDPSELPQIWVPGARHVEMLHHLEYAYWRVRKGDDRTQPLTVFARLCGWLFRESGRSGQQQIVDASKALRDAYVFPSDDMSLGNLTTSIAWFRESGPLVEKRLKVRQAGQQRVSPTLDPNLDYKTLAPLVEQRGALLKENKSLDAIEKKIYDAIAPELQVRWDSMVDAYQVLANDTRRENAGVEKLVETTMKKFVYEFQRVERNLLDPDLGPAFTPHPETDFHGSAAASSYFQMAASDSAFTANLIHDDAELQGEALANGRAFLAEVTEVWNTGVGRSTIPVWQLTVEVDEQLRLREGERYSMIGNISSSFLVRSVEIQPDNILLIEGEWVTPKIKPLEGPISAKPVDPSWVGERILFVPTDSSSFDNLKSNAVWKAKDGIGAWLTHGRAPNQVTDNIIDDITQLQSGS